MKLRIVIGMIVLLLSAPALANPGGPEWKNGGDVITNTGCTCHGDGAPSTEVVVSISGVPRSYDTRSVYIFNISLQHEKNDGLGI